ncbi:MAG: hypothetical protein QN174_02455 [Armatimonadota bacterium]|nr:hypothetical protein [Armatimonadota bacterium]MDR7421718.1 hypothetical protein [Armatimonadota bacterium]MDR7454571.1 hypothetical protein [Armatimonadota bacterium]MDR7495810.1 hypothetical protein [Armatimonadota bacterium]MDR7511466.1 hypothetical protein [Armatimonadota bacterium]
MSMTPPRAGRILPEAVTVPGGEQALRPCEAKLVACIRNHWALDFGTREVRLVIEYQDGVPVLIRVTGNIVREEKLR